MIRKSKSQKPEKPGYYLKKKKRTFLFCTDTRFHTHTHTHKNQEKKFPVKSELLITQGMEKIAIDNLRAQHNFYVNHHIS